MSASPAFPLPGSRAAWNGKTVRIHQWNGDGTALIFGDNVARRVQPDELSEAEPNALDHWIEDRFAGTGDRSFTSLEALYDDYREWSDLTGLHDFQIYSRFSLSRMLGARGYRPTKRPLGLFRTVQQFGFHVDLRPLGQAVAA
jgi:hypothetical protein